MSEKELEFPEAEVVDDAPDAPEGQADAEETTGQQTEDRQPQDAGFENLDLDKLPQFRKWKSVMDRQIGELKQQMSEAQRRAWEAEQQRHQLAMQGMDEVQRRDYMINMLQGQVQELQQRIQLTDWAYKKDQDIRQVAQKLGLSYDELVDALPQGADSYQMWEVAYDLAQNKRQGGQQAQTVRKAQNPANQVDTGSGRPTSAPHRWQKMYDEAKKNFDVSKMLDAMAGAGREGLTIEDQ